MGAIFLFNKSLKGIAHGESYFIGPNSLIAPEIEGWFPVEIQAYWDIAETEFQSQNYIETYHSITCSRFSPFGMIAVIET